ncbi:MULTISPECIES: hypothetical protein [Lysobacter]|jgi:hypothetical protein|uniref:DUF1453 domain-containing protein n=1 Tax=Lysobacter gummosus TaxID=262324 RepID=A0ABY3XF92_9GAMM|nr:MULTISPECIES: hypothetical protein [Lysobacter]ALN89683.1 hypothetical protein LG3211_0700 [Lysobacter gummosus]UJB18411.1 DUF1453 domain-containing protein [Lysobacter capsici]UJQ27865.1 DUF1453 domain-containing protein [Lysobacter gummosus]UNP30306.1 DUF1453 domain-containing protein [Lysobacter gummosus]
MPLLLLIPLLLLVLLALWALLIPIGLIQRYRYGKARRRALPWAVALATALSLISLLLFFASAWVIGHWIDDAPVYAAAGLTAGCALGALGLVLTRFEDEARGLYYTPNRWLVLGLTLIVAARVVYGLWQAAHAWSDMHEGWLPRQGSLLAVGGVLLGYYQIYTLGLRRRLRRHARAFAAAR